MNRVTILVSLLILMALPGCSPGPEDPSKKETEKKVSSTHQLPMARDLEVQAKELRKNGHNLQLMIENLEKKEHENE